MENSLTGVQLHHSVSPSQYSVDEYLPDRISADIQQIKLAVDDQHLPLTVEIESLGDTKISPHRVSVKEAQFNFSIDIKTPPKKEVRFRLLLVEDHSTDIIQSFEIQAPSFWAFECAEAILERRYSDDIFSQIGDYYGEQNKAQAIVSYLDNVIKYLSSDQFLRLLNVCAETSVELRDIVDDVYTPEFLARYLPNGRSEKYLNINTWARVRQICSTSKQLRYIPGYDEEEVIQQAIQNTAIQITQAVDTHLDRLWTLDNSLDISKRNPSLYPYDLLVGLFAKSVLESRYDRIDDLAVCLTTDDSISNLDEAIERAKSSENDRAWEGLIPRVINSNTHKLEFVLANFLYEAGKSNQVDIIYSVAAYEAAGELYDILGQNSFARSAKFYEHYLRGIKFQDKDMFEKAAVEFGKAREFSLKEIQAVGKDEYTNLAHTWANLYESLMEVHRERGDFESAVEELDDGIQSAEKFTDFGSEDDREWCVTRMEALRHEVAGDMYLADREFETAKNSYGKAIGKLKQVIEDTDREIKFLKNRRSAINGSLNESEGKYRTAAENYEEIAERAVRYNSFVKFHKTRGRICRTKERLADRDLEGAQAQLGDITYEGGTLEDEITDIQFILEMLQTYAAEEVTDVDTVVDHLNHRTSDDTNHVDLDFGYDYDYRPAVIHLLAAQRLKSVIGDEDILDSIVDVAITEVLKPSTVESTVYQEGIRGLDPGRIQRENLPTFITRQLQDVERETQVKRPGENYKAQAQNLTGILEECVEFAVAYHAKCEYGDNWADQIAPDGNVTLRNLADFLNNDVLEDKQWADEVNYLFSTVEFDDIVLDSKEGDIVDIRNDLDHSNVSFISKDEFDRIKEHVDSMLIALSRETPVIGVAGQPNAYGAYSIRLLRTGARNKVEIMVEDDLKENHIYYFPHTITSTNPGQNVDMENILQCKEEDIIESIRSHTDASFSEWKHSGETSEPE